MYSGVFVLLFTAMMMPCIILVSTWIDRGSGVAKYTTPLLSCGVVGAAAFGVWNVRFSTVGVPTCPRLLPEDDRELARMFSLPTLDHAARALEMDRVEIVRALANP